MKSRFPTLLAGILIGATLFGGGSALAAGILATPFEELNQRLTLNGTPRRNSRPSRPKPPSGWRRPWA